MGVSPRPTSCLSAAAFLDLTPDMSPRSYLLASMKVFQECFEIDSGLPKNVPQCAGRHRSVSGYCHVAVSLNKLDMRPALPHLLKSQPSQGLITSEPDASRGSFTSQPI